MTRVRDWLRSQNLPTGARAPSERQIVEGVGLSRPTVRKVLRQLEAEGWLQAVSPRVRTTTEWCRAVYNSNSNNIAVVTRVVDAQINPAQRQWMLNRMVSGIARAAAERELNSLLLNPAATVPDTVARFTRDPPRGALFLWDAEQTPLGMLPLVQELARRGLPLVVQPDTVPASRIEGLACDQVRSDHCSGCRELTQWLIRRGKRRMLRLWSLPARPEDQPIWSVERHRGHEAACAEAGIEPLPVIWVPHVPMIWEEEGFRTSCRVNAGFLIEPLKQGIDAILVPSEEHVFIAAGACRLLGLEPQRDVLIVGYDHFWETAATRRFEPSVPPATVDKQEERIAAEMLVLLLARCSGKLPPEPQQRLVAPRLVETATPS